MERARGTIIPTNSSSSFFSFMFFSMLIFKPALNVPLLDGKFSNIQIIFKSHRKMEGVRSKFFFFFFFYASFYAGTKTIFLDGVSFYRAMYRDTTNIDLEEI